MAGDAAWVCNECGSREFTGSVSESDLENLACTSCGGWDFHWEDFKPDRAPPPAAQNSRATPIRRSR